jgi:hypothetical protein
VSGGSEVTWRIRYRARIPGTSAVVRRALDKMLGQALPRLKDKAEKT